MGDTTIFYAVLSPESTKKAEACSNKRNIPLSVLGEATNNNYISKPGELHGNENDSDLPRLFQYVSTANAELQGENAELSYMVDVLQTENRRQQAQINELRTEIVRKQAEIDELRTENVRGTSSFGIQDRTLSYERRMSGFKLKTASWQRIMSDKKYKTASCKDRTLRCERPC
ncbi:hypothetical protein CYMTET_43496 [Cymbomonas tetramitiformis]|uniref:Uncharacterized protein n=1 Tax=Cymbomonas tetramitiformis TaxID=36881 RepID=A0AAE0F0K3_9CHLO|nr:hypothetical protein CYMTET_43496 [Cymbomonas tetramitiformis]